MDVFKLIIDGLWNNLLNKPVTFGVYTFPLWVPPSFAIICAFIFRFLGGGRNE